MLENVNIKNYGPVNSLLWDKPGSINLIIGNNGSGKTFLLKALYSAVKSCEEFRRGDDNRSISEILSSRLRWTFQTDKLGDLVKKDSKDSLCLSVDIDKKRTQYSFGRSAVKQINDVTRDIESRESNSVYIPAKEVLSLDKIILESRRTDRVFGFDDTYLDLVDALMISPKKGRKSQPMTDARTSLKDLIGGVVKYDPKDNRWIFKKGNQKYSMGTTADGIKKIAILDTLISNNYLSSDSVIFIDELEAALHPTAIASFLDIILTLSRTGIQFFIASHSYFVIKKLYIMALKEELSIPVMSLESGQSVLSDLKEGMPQNPIIDESIRLYREEISDLI